MLARHFVVAVFTSYCLLAQASASEPRELLRGIDNSRMRISSGVFTVTGTTVETLNGEETKNVSEDCRVLFDYDKGFYRFEREGQGIFLLTPECVYERWKAIPGDKHVAITQYELDHQPNINVNPFDIRLLGLFTCVGRYWRYSYEEYHDYLLNGAEVVEKKDGPLAYIAIASKAAASNSDASTQYPADKFWVDKENGYTTTRIEVGVQTSDISWKELNGVFVPMSCRQQYRARELDLKVDADWTFAWEMVNETVPEGVFTYQSLKSEDEESGVLYSADVDPEGSPVALDHFQDSVDSPNTQVPASNLSRILLGLGLLLILIGVGGALARAIRRRHM